MKEITNQDNLEKKEGNNNIDSGIDLENVNNEVTKQISEVENKAIEILDFKTLLELSPNFYAGFTPRFIAYMIDFIIVLCISSLVNTVTFGALDIQLPIEIIFKDKVLIVVTYIFYFVLMTYLCGQTLGKMILKIKVEKNTSGRLPFLDVIYREVVGRFINNALFFLPYLAIPFTNKKKGLHDFIADSVVIKEDFQSIRQKLNDKIVEKDK